MFFLDIFRYTPVVKPWGLSILLTLNLWEPINTSKKKKIQASIPIQSMYNDTYCWWEEILHRQECIPNPANFWMQNINWFYCRISEPSTVISLTSICCRGIFHDQFVVHSSKLTVRTWKMDAWNTRPFLFEWPILRVRTVSCWGGYIF